MSLHGNTVADRTAGRQAPSGKCGSPASTSIGMQNRLKINFISRVKIVYNRNTVLFRKRANKIMLYAITCADTSV